VDQALPPASQGIQISRYVHLGFGLEEVELAFADWLGCQCQTRKQVLMKQMSGTTVLLLLLMASWFAQVNVLAQSQPLIMKLKGAGTGGPNTIGGYGTDLQLVGDYAFLTWAHPSDTNHPGGLEIFDIRNPIKPVRLGGHASRTHANSVCVVGRYAYLAEGTVRTQTNDPGTVEIIDVSDPTNPALVGGIGARGLANAIRVVGNLAFVAESPLWNGTQALGGLEIFNVNDPAEPVRTAIFDTVGAVTSVEVSGTYAYLTGGLVDLLVLDVIDPRRPERVSDYSSDIAQNLCGFEPDGRATRVQVVDHFAYASGPNGLHVVDIHDPLHPVSVNDSFCLPCETFQVSGRRAFATVWASHLQMFLLVALDVSDPNRIVQIGFEELPGWPRAFQSRHQTLYAATLPLLVYQFSNQPARKSL